MQENTFSIKNVYKIYAQCEILSDVSFEVKGGQIVWLAGISGSGKTTCFEIASGLVGADKGSVFINQHKVDKLPMHKRSNLGLGYLPQQTSVFQGLSVEDNIMAVLELNKKLKKEDRGDRLEELIQEFDLEKVRYEKARVISGGEQRRVEIARALAIDLKFIILDEPLKGIHKAIRKDIKELIFKLKDKGIGILITGHDEELMLEISDYVYLLADGKVKATATSKEMETNLDFKEYVLGEETS